MERGVLCDVFVAIRPNLYISGFLDLTVNTTVTFWFLAVSIEASCCGLYFYKLLFACFENVNIVTYL